MTYNSEYPQGIWCLDKTNPDMAVKVVGANKIISVPVTTEILGEIKKQIEAEKIFMAFSQLNNEEENIIGYLDLILNDYINFLTPDSKNVLINKMKEIELSSQIDNQNIFHLKNLETGLKENDIEKFYDALDEFHTYNVPLFENAFSNNEAQGRNH